VRTYPRAIAGQPLAFGFDPDSKGFFLEFEPDPGISEPTEIYLPAERHYPGGWEIVSSAPAGSWRYEWDSERELLQLWADPVSTRHRVEIRATP
jgi:endoglycosylceramidase